MEKTNVHLAGSQEYAPAAPSADSRSLTSVADPLQRELDAYVARHAELMEQFPGKLVVFQGGVMWGAFDTYESALDFGYGKFGREHFMVQKVEPFRQPDFHTGRLDVLAPADLHSLIGETLPHVLMAAAAWQTEYRREQALSVYADLLALYQGAASSGGASDAAECSEQPTRDASEASEQDSNEVARLKFERDSIKARTDEMLTKLIAEGDELRAERDALLETQRKFGALMHKTMEERDSLLEALKEFVYEYDSGTLTETQRIQKARLAIVKALASEGKVA
jgi:hypothetical protein